MRGKAGLTHLRGGALAGKDHPAIALRGRLDSLCAAIVEAQVLGEQAGSAGFAEDLQEALGFARSILAAEYGGAPMGGLRLLGMTGEDLRERCQNPERHFGRGHLLMDRGMGPLCARLNSLRALAREAESAAAAAFRAPCTGAAAASGCAGAAERGGASCGCAGLSAGAATDGSAPEAGAGGGASGGEAGEAGAFLRPDILEALNGLSAFFYALTYKYLPDGHQGGR